jgi:hypothetical protein
VRKQLLDLSLALARGAGKKLLVVHIRQLGSQKADRGEVERALDQHAEDDRESPSRSRRLDAVVGFTLGESQHLPAIIEE